jgi:hypothetical protein
MSTSERKAIKDALGMEQNRKSSAKPHTGAAFVGIGMVQCLFTKEERSANMDLGEESER